jgi:hypothetical protein
MSTPQPRDPVIFVNWYLQSVYSGEFNPELTFSGSVFGHINVKIMRYWSIQNPHFIHKVTFDDVKFYLLQYNSKEDYGLVFMQIQLILR